MSLDPLFRPREAEGRSGCASCQRLKFTTLCGARGPAAAGDLVPLRGSPHLTSRKSLSLLAGPGSLKTRPPASCRSRRRMTSASICSAMPSRWRGGPCQLHSARTQSHLVTRVHTSACHQVSQLTTTSPGPTWALQNMAFFYLTLPTLKHVWSISNRASPLQGSH